MYVWAKALLSVLCAAASALFSGLILGFMSLDILQLQLLTYVEPTTNRDRIYSRYARRILPLRRDSNLLLSTLILSNSMVNALMVLLLGDMLDMTWGFVSSTLITALLGEIAPQSIFMKHALTLCGFFATGLRVLVWILYPVCKPLALLLDYLLGKSSQVIYTRQQLKALVDLQLEKGNVLTLQEAKMLKGCLEMSTIYAEDVMTPIDAVVHIEDGTAVTKEVVQNIAKSGFSNIPIVTKDENKSVVGFIVVKDLLMLNHAKSYRVRDLCDTIGKPIYAVDAESTVNDLMPLMKRDSRHVIVVRKAIINPHRGGDPIYKHVGIITVDDVLRIMLQDYDIHGEKRQPDGKEFIAKKNEVQMLKYEKLNCVKTVHSLSLNAIKAIFPIQDIPGILRALNVPENQQNVDIIRAKHIFLLKDNTLIPSGRIFVLLKGNVSYVDEEKIVIMELPCAINCGEIKTSFVTRTDCEVVEISINEEFKR
ncbi:Metal transporter CNNM4 [Babesia sp. Xinjiang]|uniref:Metal transporter CNNM4 n=1 Tax=Babesia sp. Xinjiang TaxID=462227 RepID=UPI000A264759|nr:Metal transporter CNNM4 [Babesia sp. Xinjiang]ORM41674.1 Metal transporter CNNM4 [Babesia sp. Xinjiang]